MTADLLRMLAHRARCFPNYPLGYHIPEVFAAIGEEPPQPAPAEGDGPFPAPDLRGIDGATHSEWRILGLPAKAILIQEKDLPKIIERACLAYAAGQPQPKHTAPGWADAYAAFQGAFDTPMARRRMDDEFCQDARRRLREFNDAMLAAQAPAPADGEVIDAKPKLQRRALGVCLKKLRLAHGLLIHDVAVLLNFTSAYLSQLEHGREPLTAEAAMAIATWADELPAHPRPIRSPA